jgi:O-antigen/teichoic acid export membrane protein
MYRDTLIYILSRVVPSAITFITGIALTWLLSPTQYGIYGLGIALVGAISGSLFEWHAMSFMRFVQSGSADRAFMPTVLGSFIALCAISALFAVLLGASGVLSEEYRLLLWVCIPGAWCYSWFELAVRIEVSRFHALRVFWMNLARNCGIFAVAISLATLTQSPLAVLAGTFAAMLLPTLLVSSGGLYTRMRQFDFGIVSQFWRFGWPIAIVQVAAMSSFALDRILLERYWGESSVGYYTVAYALAQTTLVTLASGVDSAIYSRVVKAVDAKDSTGVTEHLKRNCSMLLVLLVPAAVGIALTAPALAHTLVEPAYVQTVQQLMAWMAIASLVLSFRANYVDHAFHFANQTRKLTLVIVAMSVVNVAADLILIPPFGPVGAVAATIIAGTLAIVYGWIASRSVLKLPFPAYDVAKILLSTMLMAVFLLGFRGQTDAASLVVQIAGGVLVYGVAVLATNILGIRNRVVQVIQSQLRVS